MGLTQTVAPAAEPISRAEAKLFLRVDTSDEDTQIDGLITAAREKVEKYLQRQLVTATYRFTFQPSPVFDGMIDLPLPPVQSVTLVEATDSSGTVTTVSSSTYRAVYDTTPGKVVFITNPDCDGTREDAIRVTFTCGYGAASAVPQGIKIAMLWLIGSFYKNREDMDSPLNSSVERLLDLYRAFKVGV